MEKRAYQRILVHIDARFHCSNTLYYGTITNLSENGMYVITRKIYFPFDQHFNIMMLLEDKSIHLPVNIRRIVASTGAHDALAVQLSDPTQEYLDFVSCLKLPEQADKDTTGLVQH